MTDLDRALLRLLDAVNALDVHVRVALIQQRFPLGGDERALPLWTCLPVLLAMPDNDETHRCLAALVDGIRTEMTSRARRVFVSCVFNGTLEAGAAKGLLDALATVVGLIDAEDR